MTAEAPPSPQDLLIYLTAGEPSGDLLGGRLMAALRQLGVTQFAGVGGERMQAQGLNSLFPMSELSVMGLAEVVPRIPQLLKRIDLVADDIRRVRPAALVTIDAPDFSFRVTRKVRGQGIPLIHYVAPTVWAWRPGRARTIARFLDHLLALLPFEPPYFEAEGLPCSFVGHPVLESGAGSGDAARFRAAHGLSGEAPLLALLPGSRRGEVSRLLPTFLATVRDLAARHPGLACVLPTVPAVADLVRGRIEGMPVRVIMVEGDRDKYDALAASTAALAASGTVSLELAMAGTPMVIAYKVNPITAAIAPFVVRLRHVSLVNIILGRPAVPELLQDRCRPGLLVEAVGRLLRDPAARQEQIDGLSEAVRQLGPGEIPPSMRAAQTVLRLAERSPAR